MKKFFLMIGLMWFGASAALAQVETEYPDVPLDNPAYADIHLLSKPGIIECGDPTKPRLMTRYEFAVAVARLWQNKDANPEHRKSVEEDALQLAAFIRLAKAFEAELVALAANVEISKLNISALALPLNHSAYADIRVLVQTGLIEDFVHCYSPKRTVTRYEFAVAVARLIDNTQESWILADTLQALALRRLVKEFRTELKQLGVTIPLPLTESAPSAGPDNASSVKNNVPQFRDVPQTHWGYQAVEKLRQSGIVVGFPADNSTGINHPASSTAPAPHDASGRGNARQRV